jgi:hypothetical protein
MLIHARLSVPKILIVLAFLPRIRQVTRSNFCRTSSYSEQCFRSLLHSQHLNVEMVS